MKLEQVTDIRALDVIADGLYKAQATDELYATVFTLKQLKQLWDERCVYKTDKHGNLTDTAAYDDEVYNALDRYGYWDNK